MKKLLSLLTLPILFVLSFVVFGFAIQGTAHAEVCAIYDQDIGQVVYKEPEGGGDCPAPDSCNFTGDPTAQPPGNSGPVEEADGNILGIIPTWYKYLDGEVISGKCRPIINEPADALPIGLAILELMMTLGGLVAVVMIFIGAFKYILSQGEPDKAKGAQNTVINAVVGLVIVIVATRIVSFIGGRLG